MGDSIVAAIQNVDLKVGKLGTFTYIITADSNMKTLGIEAVDYHDDKEALTEKQREEAERVMFELLSGEEFS